MVKVLPSILTNYRTVQLATNVMFLNDIPFLPSIAKHLHYGVSKGLNNMENLPLEMGLKNVIYGYAIFCFSAGVIFLDN